MIANVNALFMYLEVYNYMVVFIMYILVSFFAWLFVCAIFETDQ